MGKMIFVSSTGVKDIFVRTRLTLCQKKLLYLNMARIMMLHVTPATSQR
jgi:hypothetical protein